MVYGRALYREVRHQETMRNREIEAIPLSFEKFSTNNFSTVEISGSNLSNLPFSGGQVLCTPL